MRSTLFAIAGLALLSSSLDLVVPVVDAKSLSVRHPDHEMIVHPPALHRRKSCTSSGKTKGHKKHHKSGRKKGKHHSHGNRVPTASQTASSSDSTPDSSASSESGSSSSSSSASSSDSDSSSNPSSDSDSSSGSSASATASASASASASATASGSASSASSSSSSSSSSSTGSASSNAGAAPPNSPWGNCFDLTATAFQPNWKGEASTTWCGANFDKSSPILALPLADLSKAYGSSGLVTYYSNQNLWNQMISDWCGREVVIEGPGGSFKAYFGDANLWTSVDLNMNLFTKIKGVSTGSYSDPDAAGWVHNIKGCFTGSKVSIKDGYPFTYN